MRPRTYKVSCIRENWAGLVEVTLRNEHIVNGMSCAVEQCFFVPVEDAPGIGDEYVVTIEKKA